MCQKGLLKQYDKRLIGKKNVAKRSIENKWQNDPLKKYGKINLSRNALQIDLLKKRCDKLFY